MVKPISELSIEKLADAKRKAVIRLSGDIVEITQARIEELKELARKSPLQRARYCLHADDHALVQEMIIALTHHCYLRPHRHKNKEEMFCILEGALDVVFLDDTGRETRRVEMGVAGSGKIPVYRLGSRLWHAVVPQTGTVVFSETTNGPFDPRDTEFPEWAPMENDASDANGFLARLRRSR